MPTLCLITDRHRLAAALAAPAARALDLLCDQIEGAALGGVDFVQIRERDLPAAMLAALVRAALPRVRGSQTRLLLNDRLDIAVAAGCHGVHLREDSVAVTAARRLVPAGFIVGRAVHDTPGAETSRAADYLLAGSVFETPSKPGTPASLGLSGLRAVVSAAGECPVWALGGIDSGNIGAVMATGVRGVAAIGAFIPSSPTDNLVGHVRKMSQTLRFSFDTFGTVP